MLLKSAGKCTACGETIDLRGSAAREGVHIHTAENGVDQWNYYGPAHDWPAVLCCRCQTEMTEGGFSTFLDYRFSFHPSCPRCGASQTRSASIGMPNPGEPVPPWTVPLGCVVTDPVPEWICGGCGYRWAT
ncbi:alkylphosphonate uptake protein [Rhodococcus sp. ACS1]|nr:alkylphosphonate uptake protein [Rhodococcus sp. ACS1]